MSFGDDKQVIIWRVGDWTIQATVADPYSALQQPSQSHRMSWSPDGQLLLTTNGFRDLRFTAPVLARGTWSPVVSFMGHSRATSAGRFSPCLMRDGKDSGKPPQTMCAVGGNDGAVTVWTQQNPKALVAVADLFEYPVTDIAW